jgi:Asp-tRNA(Asn)/Glu-tRNA(Gln) amidotransferase C subunit
MEEKYHAMSLNRNTKVRRDNAHEKERESSFLDNFKRERERKL